MADSRAVYVVQYFDPQHEDWFLGGVFDDKDILDDWVCANVPEECTITTYPVFLNHPTPFAHVGVYKWNQ